jgi:hypothetical protein
MFHKPMNAKTALRRFLRPVASPFLSDQSGREVCCIGSRADDRVNANTRREETLMRVSHDALPKIASTAVASSAPDRHAISAEAAAPRQSTGSMINLPTLTSIFTLPPIAKPARSSQRPLRRKKGTSDFGKDEFERYRHEQLHSDRFSYFAFDYM